MKQSPRYSCALLSLAVVWSSVGTSIPAFAAELEAVPTARLTTLEPVKIPGNDISAQIPSLPAALAPVNGLVPMEAMSAAALPEAAQTAQAAVSAAPAALAAPKSEKPGVLSSLAQAAGQVLLGRSVSWSSVFDMSRAAAPADAMGIRPLPKPVLPQDFNLGDAPKTPDPKKVRTVNIQANAIDAPGARTSGGIFGAGPRVLNASVRGTQAEIESSVKEALLRMIDNDAAKWGVTRDELKEVHVRYVPGEGDQIGQVFAYFQQQRKTTGADGATTNAVVNGTSLSFTVNIVKNQPILMAASAKLYPNLNVAARATKTDDELKQVAEDQLRQMPQGAGVSLVFVERRIVYHEGAWHAVNLYDIDGLGQYVGVKVAIDIATGDIFAWDSRVGVRDAATKAPEQGRFAIAYRDERPLTDEARSAMKDFLAKAGMTLATEGNGGTLLVVDGPVDNMAKIVSNEIFKGWTIHRYTAPKMAYPEASARLEAARQAAPAGAQLIGAAANLLNKSNIWAYRFYVPATNQVLEVYVNFKGEVHATDARPAPSGTDFNEIDLSKIMNLETAYSSVLSRGVNPTAVRIERWQTLARSHPVQYIFTDASGKETVMLAQAAAEPDAASVSGVVQARAEANDHRQNGEPVLVDLATPYIKFTLDGKADMADTDGKFAGKGKTFTATVESKWAKIHDTDRKELKVNVTLDPSKPNVVVLNPEQNDLGTINQVNMLIWINRIHDWWSTRLNADARIDKQIPVNVNIHQDCNAYYTPGRPSLNFFRDSEECSDTGRPGVGMHEYGHFVDDMIGGITNGGMSEGWGDIGSMFILGTPIIGEGFLKNRNPSWIRHGENTYQYSDSDEVHDQGQAWMGFAWKLRKALIASLGEAKGAATAESLIVPTLFAKTSDIPSQMAQVLLRAMGNDGTIRFEKEIRAAAKAHGIDLPQNPGIVGGVADLANGLVGVVTGGAGVAVEEIASDTFEGANALVPEGFGQGASAQVVTKTFSLSAGRAARDEIRAKLQGAYQYRSGDYHDLGFKIEEQRGWRNSQFTITITGSAKSTEYMATQIKRIGGQTDEAAPAGEKPAGPSGVVGIRATTNQTARPATEASAAPEAPKAPRDLTMKEFGVINAAGVVGSIGAGILTGHVVLGLLGTFVAAIPLVIGYVLIARALGANIRMPGIRFAPSFSWGGKKYGKP